MGKYDYVDRKYFSDRTRFAELITKGFYNGKVQVFPEELQRETGVYPALSNTQGTLERDVLFLCKKHCVMYGMEIENYSDLRMPERCFVYDACEYERQVGELYKIHREKNDYVNFIEKKSLIRDADLLYPVCNFLLYLGPGTWKGRKKFQELINIPQEIYVFLKDKLFQYAFPVINADEVKPEQFQTDLRQFFMAMRYRSDKVRMVELLTGEDFQNLCKDAQNVIAVHLGDKNLIKKVVEEGADMCKAMREWRQELLILGRTEGELIGKEIGRTEGELIGKEIGRAEERERIISCLTRMREGANMTELVAEGYSESLVQSLMTVQ